jgi:hypothetical protein
MNMFWVSEGKPEGELSPKKEKKYSEANTIFCGAMVGVLAKTARYIPLLQNCKRDVGYPEH